MTRHAIQRAPLALSSFTSYLTTGRTTAQQCPGCRRPWRRVFSSSSNLGATRLRSQMFAWLNTRGKNFETVFENDTNYLTDYEISGLRRDDYPGSSDRGNTSNKRPRRPFPLNEHFISQPILSEELREEIWTQVRVEKKSVRTVSVELGVEMRRVGAVIRLKAVEQQWRAENKPLAIPYAEAIHSMVPTTPLTDPPQPHESINDLPVHKMTVSQIFYPTSESRQFNRVDAGRVFSGAPRLPDPADDADQSPAAVEPWKDSSDEIIGRPGYERPVLKPADARIPHPHLIAYEKDKLERDLDAVARNERYQARLDEEAEQRASRKQREKLREKRHTSRVETARCDFLFKDCQTTRLGTGLDGRGTASPGIRYGVPSQDRKRGLYKLPKKVEL